MDVYICIYVENIMNMYISLYSSVWNKRLGDNIYYHSVIITYRIVSTVYFVPK